MAIAEISGDRGIVLDSISWETYERLLREVGERHVRMTYDNGDLEIMTLSFGHENAGELLGRFVTTLALILSIPLRSGGSTTLRRKLKRKGLEPDKCFWIKTEKAMRNKSKWNPKSDPPPDLAIEVDVTRSSLNRMGIYAALRVPEIWRYRAKKLRVYCLDENGTYHEMAASPTFPYASIAKLNEFLGRADRMDETALLQSFTDWVNKEVAPLAERRAPRNGSKSE